MDHPLKTFGAAKSELRLKAETPWNCTLQIGNKAGMHCEGLFDVAV
jgi:hypothetical protein